MKHFFTLLAAMAFASAIEANAQQVNQLSKRNRSLEPKSLSEVRMPASQLKGMHKAPGFKVMKSPSAELAGPAIVVYESSSYDDEGNPIPLYYYYGIDVANNGDGTIMISGFGQWLTNSDVNDITAKLDEDGNFEMDSQVLFTSSDYGNVSIAAWDYDEETNDLFPVRDAKITGSYIDGELVFDTPWGAFIDAGEYKDYYFEIAFTTGIVNATGVMTDTDKAGDQYHEYIVHAIEGDSIYVGGFFGMGESAVMKYDLTNKTITIPNQRILYYSSTYGVFYSYAFNRLLSGSSGPDISGTFNESEISWGPWGVMNAQGDYLAYKGSKIQFFEGYNLIEDITSVKQVETSKEVARSKFYNVQGIETTQPQKGVNIQVTEYTDGSKKTVKILK